MKRHVRCVHGNVEPITVDAACFERWLKAYEGAAANREDSEAEFFDEYDVCMTSALRYGAKRFASA